MKTLDRNVWHLHALTYQVILFVGVAIFNSLTSDLVGERASASLKYENPVSTKLSHQILQAISRFALARTDSFGFLATSNKHHASTFAPKRDAGARGVVLPSSLDFPSSVASSLSSSS